MLNAEVFGLKIKNMKKIITAAILSIFSLFFVCGQDINTELNEYYNKGYLKNNVDIMLTNGKKIIQKAPDRYEGYTIMAYAYLMKNDIKNAEKYVKMGTAIGPVEQSNYAINSYISAIRGNMAQAEKLMNFAFQMRFDDNMLADTQRELSLLEQKTGKDFSLLKNKLTNINNATSTAPQLYLEYMGCLNGYFEGKACNMNLVLSKYKKFTPYNFDLELNALYFEALANYRNANWNGARQGFEDFINHKNITNYPGYYAKGLAFERLSWFDDYDANRLVLMTNNGIKETKKMPFGTLLECDLIFRNILGLKNANRNKEALTQSQKLLKQAVNLNYTYKIIEAHNSIGAYYLMNFSQNSTSLANQHLGKAYSMAVSNDYKDLKATVGDNYAVLQWKLKNYSRAKQLSLDTYNYYKNNKLFLKAQNTANNLAFMYYIQNKFTDASQMFQKAVDITEEFLPDMSASLRLATMDKHSSAYSGLIMSLAKSNNPERLFKVQDMNRSRLLGSKLGTSIKKATLQNVQANLKSDEVLLYYSETTPGEMVVTVVTNNSISVKSNHPVTAWLNIKKQFINPNSNQPNTLNGYVTKLNEYVKDGRVYTYKNAADNFKAKDYKKFIELSRYLLKSYKKEEANLQTTFLKHWYNYLIKPIEGNLAGKRKIIVSAEGGLNSIPFEAFLNPQGQYLLENFDVKYIPSATVWLALQNRTYSNSRKPLLAMGGATYAPSKKVTSGRDANAFYQAQNEILTSIRKDKINLSKELDAIGFGGANYLPGSLKEVQNLKSIIPEAKVLVDQQMKESDIKNLNKTGELSNYKYVHIATHGFALSDFPEMSGVMMTQVVGGKDGNEDSFLLAYEIEKLKLKADMAVLSACDTAMGKSYKGEGVNGLNSALLVAGANNTLLSLWPVSDAGTMILMTEVYNNLHTLGMTVDVAVNSAKRKMLKGDAYGAQFSTPVIWAPFVVNGK